ncbi:hypothetical protein ES707_03373 [subsurface metagenome]
MSYRKTWSKTWNNTEFKDPVPVEYPGAARPTRHASTGFRSYADMRNPLLGRGCEGLWLTRSPINIINVMPGTQQKILKVTVEGYHGLGGVGFNLQAILKILGNGSVIFDSGRLSHGDEKWELNLFEREIDISRYSNLNLSLYQNTSLWLGETEQIDADITVTAEYYVDVPPVTADVEIEVINKETGLAIKNAFIRLMSGSIVVGTGYTDGQGLVKFINIDEGSYILSASAADYYPTELAIKIEAPAVYYILKLVKVVKPPTPWYVYAGVGGIGLLTVFAIVPALIRKPTPPIMIVR